MDNLLQRTQEEFTKKWDDNFFAMESDDEYDNSMFSDPEKLKEFISVAQKDVLREVVEHLPKGDANPFNHEYTKGWNDCVGVTRTSLQEMINNN